jgi:flavin-binding protein dodecin
MNTSTASRASVEPLGFGVVSDHVYKSIEVTGTSSTGVDDAISGAIVKAAETVRNLDWYEVTQIRGHIEDGKPAHVQVTLKIGFRLD